MKEIEKYIGKDLFFSLWFAVIVCIALLSGCATKPAGDVKPAETAITPHEAMAAAVQACTGAVQLIATSAAGDAASKVAAVGAIERMCGSGGAQTAFRTAPAPEPASLGATLWQAGLQVADLVLRGYGLKSNRDVAINANDNASRTAIASYSAFQGIAGAGFAANSTIAGLIQAPSPSITLSGTGVIGSGSYVGPVTRNCTGGSGQAGAAGTGTATIPAAPGAAGPGGAANC